MIACNEIISVLDVVSTKTTNTIAINVPINYGGRKIRLKIDCYILHRVLLLIILLLLITVTSYHYTKKHWCTINIKRKITFVLKGTCYYCGKKLKLQDFDIHNILVSEKLQKNNLICDIWNDKRNTFPS